LLTPKKAVSMLTRRTKASLFRAVYGLVPAIPTTLRNCALDRCSHHRLPSPARLATVYPNLSHFCSPASHSGQRHPLLEKKADQKWGGQAEYEDYKKKTPVLIPRL
jgi:hypothetical protein